MFNEKEDMFFELDSGQISDPNGFEAPLDMTEGVEPIEISWDSASEEYLDEPDFLETEPLYLDRSDAEIAEDVENTLLQLLESGDTNQILVLTGKSIPTVKDASSLKAYQGFSQDYAKAVSYNPALKWYPRFLSQHKPEAFKVSGGALELEIGRGFLSSVLKPHRGDFSKSLRGKSPIVSVVSRMLDSLEADYLKTHLQDIKHEMKPTVEDNWDVSSADFTSEMMDTEAAEIASGSEVRVDDSGTVGLTQVNPLEIVEEAPEAKVSLRDLSNKAMAEYLFEKTIVAETAREMLKEEGVKNSTINEILGILKYKYLDSDLHKKESNLKKIGVGQPSVDFHYEV